MASARCVTSRARGGAALLRRERVDVGDRLLRVIGRDSRSVHHAIVGGFFDQATLLILSRFRSVGIPKFPGEEAPEAGLALSGLQFFRGAPIAPALPPVHRHGPQDDNGDRRKAADRNPSEVTREKLHGQILARWGDHDPQGSPRRAGGPER